MTKEKMIKGNREKDIKLLIAKFVELVESLNPGERLSIRKVTARGKTTAKKSARAGAKRSKAKKATP